jgi:hypothetical protein
VLRWLTVDQVHNIVARARNLKEGTRLVSPY